VLKLNALGNNLLFSRFLGGTNWDVGTAVAVDTAGNAYVAGDTLSANFPVSSGAQLTLGGKTDAFVTKFSSGGAVSWSTFLGGAGDEHAGGIAVDSGGNAYVAGGTSSINGMVYMRGHPADYDRWHELGCTGWNWESVLRYFKKAEDQESGADEFHGVGGPLCVSDPLMRPELADRWIAAAIEAGLPPNKDFNGERQEGVGHFQSTTKRGRRWRGCHSPPAASRDWCPCPSPT